jgi:phosphoglucosamine mutase
MSTVESRRLGKAERVDDAAGRYIEFCKSTVPPLLSLQGIRIVVDCAHGATYHIAPHVFDELGADVVAIGDRPNGLNINDGVGSTHPQTLQQEVLKQGADVGVALDGDGDRAILVDADGELVDGDDLLYIIASARLANGGMQAQSVVGTQMTNLGLEHALQKLGLGFERTQVGDRYIMARLLEQSWLLGGEPSGHVICLDRTSTGDGIVSALQVLAEMRRTGRSLKELRAGLEKYPQLLVNVRLGQPVDVVGSEPVQDAVRTAEAALGREGRVLLRCSGTEPLVRVMVEGRDAEQVRQLAEYLADVVRSQLE